MSKRTTEEYLDKEAAMRYLQASPERILYGYPDGPGRIYRFRWANGRIEFGAQGGFIEAKQVWERAVKFSDQKLYCGYTTTTGKNRLRRELGHKPRGQGVVTTSIATSNGYSRDVELEKIKLANALLQSVNTLLGK